jgi:disease resistance protein RPM1
VTVLDVYSGGFDRRNTTYFLYGYTRNWDDFKIVNGMQAPSNICRLANLQSVGVIELKGDLIRKIQSMTQLTSIRISNVKAVDEMDLCDSIQNMRLLRSLSIIVTNKEETLQMDALSSPPPDLQRLHLVGRLEKVP